jgi:hypothetical protein
MLHSALLFNVQDVASDCNLYFLRIRFHAVVTLQGGLYFEWCALDGNIDVSGCLKLTVGVSVCGGKGSTRSSEQLTTWCLGEV